jgi:O-antigen/teichoic acid export membrane protein
MRNLLNKQLFEVAAGKLVTALAGIGFVAVAARYCSPDAYGDFALAFALANLFSVVSAVWISQSVLRYVGSGIGLQSIYSVVIVVTALTTLVSFGGLLLGSFGVWPASDQPATAVYWVVPLLAVALSLNVIILSYAAALQQFRAIRIAEVARGALLLILVTAVAYWQADARGLMLAYAGATLASTSLLLMRLDTLHASNRDEKLVDLLYKFLQYGWPMTIWAGLQATQALVERSVLGTELDPTKFGSFMAATDLIVRGVGLALMPVVTFIHARMMATVGHGTEIDVAGRKLLKSGLQLTAMSGVALTTLVVLLRDLLAKLSPGVALVDTMTLLLMCGSATLWALALIVHKPLELAKQTKRMSALLGLVVGIQWLLLEHLVGEWRELSMPFASCVAALLYIASCHIAAHRRTIT